MARYVFPRVGRRPVSEVNTTDVLEILTPMDRRARRQAREVRLNRADLVQQPERVHGAHHRAESVLGHSRNRVRRQQP